MGELRRHLQIYLQGVMSRGICTDREMKSLLKDCSEFCKVPLVTVEQAVRQINTHIKPLHMEIKKGFDEDEGNCYWVFANTVENEISLLASDYTVHELEFFKKIIEKLVVENDTGVISSTRILNLVDEMDKHMSKKDAQDLLERFVQDAWFVEDEGEISFSIRSILELEHYFREVFPDDIITCTMCKQLVFKGQKCVQCPLKMHNHCANRYFRNRQKNTCPECSTQWSHKIS